MEIRILTTEEEKSEARRLALSVFMEYEAPIYSQEGIDDFTNYVENVAPTAELEYYGAFDGDTLIGTMVMREPNHLTFAFIRTDYQHSGVGRKLFHLIISNRGNVDYTVCSSPIATGFYTKLGFTATAPEMETNGVRFTPMTRPKFEISVAEEADVEALLQLQYRSFGPLAERLKWDNAPNMVETLDEARESFKEYTTFKITRADGRIIGSVRGQVSDGVMHIGRLMVSPEAQGMGLGRLLLREVIARLPHDVARLETCLEVKETQAMYRSEGFSIARTEPIGNGLTWAHMERHNERH